MRTLNDQEVECVKDIALRLVCKRIIELTATILGITTKEVRSYNLTPEVRDFIVDEASLTSFLHFWEEVVVQAVMISDFIEDGDRLVTALATVINGELVTRVFIHDETDIEDD